MRALFLLAVASHVSAAAVGPKAPIIQLNDGRSMPALALGTWLGNSTTSAAAVGPKAPIIQLNDGRSMPALALGTWLGNSTTGRIVPESNEVDQAVSWAIDAEYRHIDTAWAYRTEEGVGRAVRGKVREGVAREQLFITTKSAAAVGPKAPIIQLNDGRSMPALALGTWLGNSTTSAAAVGPKAPIIQLNDGRSMPALALGTWLGNSTTSAAAVGPKAPIIQLNDGRSMPALALGTWLGNSTTGRIVPESNEVDQAVSWAIDAGYRHIDTAWAYRTEEGVGRAVRGKVREGVAREQLFITTKSAAAVGPKAPIIQLNDGRSMPALALGTWLGNSTTGVSITARCAGAACTMRALFLLAVASHVSAAAVGPKAPIIQLNDGRSMPALALGTWLGNSTTGRIVPESNEVDQAVSWAIDAGYRHIDTAWAYRTEEGVGRAVRGKLREGVGREQLFITTKLWNDAHAQAAVVPALRRSLAQLGLDYVDLYLVHWPLGQFLNQSYDLTDYLETWRGMVQARQLGLARSIGLSNFNQGMMDRIRANGLPEPAVLQVELNLNLQQPALLAYCRAHNITVMGYSPFGSLFPSKAAPSAPPPRADDPALGAAARAHNKTAAQLALRYLVSLDVVPIPKSLTKSRIEQNIDIFDFNLTESDKVLLRSYDKGYRTIPQWKWLDHPYYPFEKKTVEISSGSGFDSRSGQIFV